MLSAQPFLDSARSRAAQFATSRRLGRANWHPARGRRIKRPVRRAERCWSHLNRCGWRSHRATGICRSPT